jgi:hypothetical protein
MTTLREAAQQALEALIARAERGDGAPDTVAALRAALEQPEQSITPRELAAALGWPGGISDPVLDKVEVLRMVARRHCESGGEMTQGDIIRMAREVGASAFDQTVVFTYEEAARFAALVAAAERARIIKMLREMHENVKPMHNYYAYAANCIEAMEEPCS